MMQRYFTTRRPATARRLAFRPALEILEGRIVLDAVRWINPAGGDWATATNWDAGRVPGAGDDVTIANLNAGATVTHSTGTDSIHSLAITAANAAFTLSGGSLAAAGGGTILVQALTLSGGSLAFPGGTVDVTGTFMLSGGALRNATVTADTTITGTVSGGTLDGVTINGELDLFSQGFNGAVANVTNGLTLNGTVRMDSNFFGAALLRFLGTETLDGTGTVFFLNGQYSTRDTVQVFTSGTTLTIGPGITITGAGDVGYNAGEGGPTDVSFLNEGTIANDVPNATLTLAGTGWQNAGSLRANFGSVISLNGTFDNADSTGTLAGMGFFTVTGEIDGGTIDLPAGAKLHGGNGTLNGVTVNGDIDLTAMGFTGSSLNVSNDLTLNGSAFLNDSFFGSALLRFLGSETLQGAGTIVFGPPQGTMNAVQVVNDATTLTIGRDITIRGQFGTVGGSGNVAFVNQGTIAADVPGGTITLDGTNWGNVGTVAAGNGGTLVAQGRPTNMAGTTLVGGIWQVGSYSTLRLIGPGIVTNAADIDLEGLGSNFYSDTATTDALANLAVNAGTFTIALGRNFTAPGAFLNVGAVAVGNASRFSATGNYVQLDGDTTLAGGTLKAGTLVDIEGGTFAGWGTVLASVRNAGQLSVGADATAGTLTIQGDFTQTTGILNLAIGTPDAGGSDQLAVTGRATLDGTLDVTLLDSFVANAGDAFAILTFGSRTGDFAAMNLPSLDDGYFLDPVYSSHGLTLVTTGSSDRGVPTPGLGQGSA